LHPRGVIQQHENGQTHKAQSTSDDNFSRRCLEWFLEVELDDKGNVDVDLMGGVGEGELGFGDR
jgi:hypothetical protein